MDVAIVLFDGFEELDAVGPYEVFATAADLGAELTVSMHALEPRDRITARHGLRVEPDRVLPSADDPDRPTILVVPGGGWSDRNDPGAWREAERGDLPRAVATHHEAGTTVAGVCTGGMLLARAGLLDGRPAVTHASALEDLADAGANVVDARVVDDGDVVTAAGVTSGLDLALHLVERIAGPEIATRAAEQIEYDRRS